MNEKIKKQEYAMALAVLHKYWNWSNMMRIKFFEQISNEEEMRNIQNFHLTEMGVYMMYWYSSLYAVIEGYRDFKMKNVDIDNLLNDSEKLDLLRKFRNGAFHVQKEYFSEKYINLIVAKNSAEWVSCISQNMGKYLIEEINRLKA